MDIWLYFDWEFGVHFFKHLHRNRNDHDGLGNFKSGRYEVYSDLLPQAIINNNFNYFKK